MDGRPDEMGTVGSEMRCPREIDMGLERWRERSTTDGLRLRKRLRAARETQTSPLESSGRFSFEDAPRKPSMEGVCQEIRHWVERRNRTRLDDKALRISQTPFGVLRGPVMRFNPASECSQPGNLRIGHGLPALFTAGKLPSGRATARDWVDGHLLRGNFLGDNGPGTNLVESHRHEAGYQCLPHTKGRLNRGHRPVSCDGVGLKEDSRHVRYDQFLHHHRSLNLVMLDAVGHPVSYGPVREQAGPTPPHCALQILRPFYIEIGILLSREGCGGWIFSGRARSDGVRLGRTG